MSIQCIKHVLMYLEVLWLQNNFPKSTINKIQLKLGFYRENSTFEGSHSKYNYVALKKITLRRR